MSVIVDSVLALQVFTASDYGRYLYATNPQKYSSEHSSRVQAQKYLNEQVAYRKLEKRKDYYCLPSYRGEHQEHSRLLNTRLIDVLIVNPQTIIYRERNIPEVGLRPDALLFVPVKDKALCVVLEVVHNEPPAYLKQKITAWQNWTEANRYLSNLFSHEILCFSIVVGGDCVLPDIVSFEQFIAEVKNESSFNISDPDNFR